MRQPFFIKFVQDGNIRIMANTISQLSKILAIYTSKWLHSASLLVEAKYLKGKCDFCEIQKTQQQMSQQGKKDPLII